MVREGEALVGDESEGRSILRESIVCEVIRHSACLEDLSRRGRAVTVTNEVIECL